MKKRETGFSLLELMVAVAILVSVMGVTLKMLLDVSNANQGITLLADMTENLRAGMTFMQRDLTQAGEGLPQSGITYPQGGTAKAIAWPAAPPAINQAYPFAAPLPQSSTLNALAPGDGLGNAVKTVATDLVSALYVDTSLQDSNGNYLNSYPINNGAGSPSCSAGSINAQATTVTFDATCINITGTNGIKAGDLIMFSNSLGYAVQTVTSVSGQTVSFAANDSFNFNGQLTAATGGTMKQMQNGAAGSGGPYPATTAARVKLVTYYIDATTNSSMPSLIRRINFNTAYPVAQGIEDLQITYGIANSANAAAYGAAGVGNAKYPISPDTPTNIRTVNLFMAARSESAYSQTGQFFRNNMMTTICVRSLSFVNRYP
jgi:prepilin-type N-terminal cleavage/methylation domain-containing protein